DSAGASIVVRSCRAAIPQSYSPKVMTLTQNLDANILSLERFLETLRPFKSKVFLEVNDIKPLHFKVSSDTMQVGTQLIEAHA
ncbi:MAG: hypothetical protein V4736_00535, partial [Bdellovibrionota bacterium]